MLFKNIVQRPPQKQHAYRGYIMACLTLSMINASAGEPVITELITNGNFELGNWNCWTITTEIGYQTSGFFLSRPGINLPVSIYSTAINPAGGNYYMVTDQDGAGRNSLTQKFTVPANTTTVTLEFQMFVNSYSYPYHKIISPFGLDLTFANQHARVDILRADATPFDTSGTVVLRNLYIGADYGLNPHNYTSYSFDITDTVLTPGEYILRFAEVDNQNFFHMGIDNVSLKATIVETPEEEPVVDNPSPAGCQLYGVQDNGLNNSEFFTLQTNGETNTFANQPGHDIESLAIHPIEHWLYGISSGDVDAGQEKGYLYRIDAMNGELYPVGDVKNETLDFDEVDSLSFNHADNSLWGWAKGYGLIKINPLTAQATLELPSLIQIEGLTWDINGNLLYGAQGTTLWVYDKSNLSTNKHDCVLPGQVEALEMIQHQDLNWGNPFLLIGIHNNKMYNLVGIDLNTCDTVIETPVPYNDVEGLAFEPKTCITNELPPLLPKPIFPISYQPYINR